MLGIQSKQLTMTQTLMKLKRILLIKSMANILLPTSEFNKLTAENLAARLAQANLVTKTDFANKMSSLNKKKLLQIKQCI